jgi:hypothetical protein
MSVITKLLLRIDTIFIKFLSLFLKELLITLKK